MKQKIDVFISSTSIDLPEYREAVRGAILQLGLFPSGMEHWPVSGENPVDLCKRMVEDAEIYLGIYAHRYGWRPDGYDGLSITELEYNWAKPIPRLCFIMSDKHPWPKEKMEHDAQDALDRFKTRVKQNQVGFFTSPEDLKAQVLAALINYIRPTGLSEVTPYLRWLHEQSKKSGLLRVLNPRDLTGETKEISVDQVYTPLNVQSTVFRDEYGKIIPGIGDALRSSKAAKDFKIRLAEVNSPGTSVLTAMEAVNIHSRKVLLGDPGSGKSTFVNFLALCLTGHALNPDSPENWMAKLEAQGWAQGEKWPIVVTLRDLAQDISDETEASASAIYQHIKRQLDKWQLHTAFAPLCRAIDEGRALLLFDGLDEVPGERREWMRTAVGDFIERVHPDNRILVTCRILSYANPDWQIPGLAQETIAPFSPEQIENFIQAWYRALRTLRELDAHEADERVNELVNGLQHPHLQEIASNPMLLTVMAVVHNHSGTLPRESARLYEECVRLLMQRWRPYDARTLLETLDVREDDLYRMLWEIAYDAHKNQAEREGAADIAETDILLIARKRLKDDTKLADEFCRYVEKTAGLLIGRGYDAKGWRVYTFPHRTFQEYLAGCYIAADRFSRHAPKLATQPGWREALLLATGHLVFNNGDVATPLDAIDKMCSERFRPQSADDWRTIWLAGDMLLLIGVTNAENDEFGQEILPRVRDLLADLVSGGHLSVIERAACGRILGLLGDPRPGVGVIITPHLSGEGTGGKGRGHPLQFLRQPFAKRHRLIPTHADDRMIGDIPRCIFPIARLRPVFLFLLLPPCVRPISAIRIAVASNEWGELGVGDGIFADGVIVI